MAPNYPMIADPDRTVAQLYGMIHPNASDTMTVRSVLVIGPDKKVKLQMSYPASTGRNFDELLRAVDSLQLTAKYQVATPVNWRQGEDVIIVPAVSDEDAKRRYPEGWTTVKPYLRVVPRLRETEGVRVAAFALSQGREGGTRRFVACSNAYASSISRGSLHAVPVKLTP